MNTSSYEYRKMSARRGGILPTTGMTIVCVETFPADMCNIVKLNEQ